MKYQIKLWLIKLRWIIYFLNKLRYYENHLQLKLLYQFTRTNFKFISILYRNFSIIVIYQLNLESNHIKKIYPHKYRVNQTVDL